MMVPERTVFILTLAEPVVLPPLPQPSQGLQEDSSAPVCSDSGGSTRSSSRRAALP